MSISQKINQVFNLFGLHVNRVSSPLFNTIAAIPGKDYSVEKDKILLKRLNVSIPNVKSHPLLDEYHHAVRIVEEFKGVFYYDENDKLKVKLGDIQLYINESEELFIISEVFLNGGYNILHPGTNSVVIDIGMNVAITSLYFSSRKEVERIYSYELFPITYEKAIKNIKSNTSGGKITAFEYGLGKEDAKLVLPYSNKVKGRMGINGLPKDTQFEDITMQEVVVKKASNEIKKVAEQNVGKFIICKVDCEGAEYEIIEELYTSNVINLINVYMIEWHYEKPASIIKALEENNFITFYLTFPADNAGMLYAVRQ